MNKAMGLCHGLAGNAYAFFYMYRDTGDANYLYKAVEFAK